MSLQTTIEIAKIKTSVENHLELLAKEWNHAKFDKSKKIEILAGMRTYRAFITDLSMSVVRIDPAAFKELEEINISIAEAIEEAVNQL